MEYFSVSNECNISLTAPYTSRVMSNQFLAFSADDPPLTIFPLRLSEPKVQLDVIINNLS